MTDLEITRRCAVAMGYSEIHKLGDAVHDASGFSSTIRFKPEPYLPLTNDAQAMALGKKFPDEFKSAVEEWAWQLSHGSPNFDLNYCFCGRVAKMQQSKQVSKQDSENTYAETMRLRDQEFSHSGRREKT